MGGIRWGGGVGWGQQVQHDNMLHFSAIHSPVLPDLFHFFVLFFPSSTPTSHTQCSHAAASLCCCCCCGFTATPFMAVSTSCPLRLLLCFLRRAVTFLKASGFKTRPFVCCSVVRCWSCDQKTFSPRNVTSVARFQVVSRHGTALLQ